MFYLEVIFVRHGESKANVMNVFSNAGYKHGLTDRGVMQAKSLAKRLEETYSDFVKIYCSPLKRAVETAEILSKKLRVNYKIDSRLREFSVGELEAKSDSISWAKFTDLWKEWFENNNVYASIAGGESLAQIIVRVNNFLDYLKLRYCTIRNERIIVICHGGVIMSSLPFLVSNLSKVFRNSFQLDPTDYITLEILESEIFVQTIYCTLKE